MPDTCTRGVYSVLVAYLCYEERSAVHLSTECEVLRVEIAIDRRTYRVVLCYVRAVDREPVACSVSRGFERGIVGIDIDETCAVGIVDVLWNGKREGELAILNLVGSVIEGVLSVGEDKGGISTLACGVIQFASDSLLRIAYHSIQCA